MAAEATDRGMVWPWRRDHIDYAATCELTSVLMDRKVRAHVRSASGCD